MLGCTGGRTEESWAVAWTRRTELRSRADLGGGGGQGGVRGGVRHPLGCRTRAVRPLCGLSLCLVCGAKVGFNGLGIMESVPHNTGNDRDWRAVLN